MISNHDLAQLQLNSYEYPNANDVSTPFTWDFLYTGTNLRAGIKIVDSTQVIILPGTGGEVNEQETIRQWELDFYALPLRTTHPVFGWVVSGFYNELDDFTAFLKLHLKTNLPICVIGHSRGAAQAPLVTALLTLNDYTVSNLVAFAPPRPGGAQLATYINKIPKTLYRTIGSESPGHDLVTDVPYDVPLIEPCIQVGALTDLTVTPLPNDPWFVFRYHHMQLYAGAI